MEGILIDTPPSSNFYKNQAKPVLKPFALTQTQINTNRYYLTRKLNILKMNSLTSIPIIHLDNYKYNQKVKLKSKF